MLATVAGLVLLFRPGMRHSTPWRATVTPLASIIGSGFLVVAPLLAFAAGVWALPAMAAIVGLAYLVGSAVRYNIHHTEPIVGGVGRRRRDEVLEWMERASKVALALAYVIAVAFYLELLGAFVLRLFGIHGGVGQKWIASALLALIGGVGLVGGLRKLEALEEYAVSIKLAIIGGFLAALVFHNGDAAVHGTWAIPSLDVSWGWTNVRRLLGAFLIVQGFETSRYLGAEYDGDVRALTMRRAQWIAGVIYLLFVGLSTMLLGVFDTISETGIIDLSDQVASSLPVLLVVGAVMAQFSAAVADTVGSGGLVEEATHERVGRRGVYVTAAVLAAGLLWSVNIFQVIAYAQGLRPLLRHPVGHGGGVRGRPSGRRSQPPLRPLRPPRPADAGHRALRHPGRDHHRRLTRAADVGRSRRRSARGGDEGEDAGADHGDGDGGEEEVGDLGDGLGDGVADQADQPWPEGEAGEDQQQVGDQGHQGRQIAVALLRHQDCGDRRRADEQRDAQRHDADRLAPAMPLVGSRRR